MIIAFPLCLVLLLYALYVRDKHGSRFNRTEKFVNGALVLVGATGTAICAMVWTTLWEYGLKPLFSPISEVISDAAYTQTTVLGFMIASAAIAAVVMIILAAHRRNSVTPEPVPVPRKRRRPSAATQPTTTPDMRSASLAPRATHRTRSARLD